MEGKIEVCVHARDYEPFWEINTYNNTEAPDFIGKVLVSFEIPEEIQEKLEAHIQARTARGEAQLIKS